MKIALLTNQNSYLGMGHFQRVLSLLKYFNQRGRHSAFMIVPKHEQKRISSLMPHELTGFISEEIPYKTDLIIRDMRDSATAEILSLKKIAPTIVIDDRGDGRAFADKAIDLLPHPLHTFEQAAYYPEAFVYGYEFMTTAMALNKDVLEKNIPFVVYAGYNPDKKRVERLLSMLPRELHGIMLAGKEHHHIKNGELAAKANTDYAELILSTQAVISHFGTTMYEAALGGASLIALNISKYHSRLCECAPELNILRNELFETAEPSIIRDAIKKAADMNCTSINMNNIKNKLLINMKNFEKLLEV